MKNRCYDVAEVRWRDFVLQALADGARIGYDASGRTWAIVDESASDSLGEIAYDDNPSIGKVAVYNYPGGVCEWGYDGVDDQGFHLFFFDEHDHYRLAYRGGLWTFAALINIDGKWYTRPGKWYESPTIPANEIEECLKETWVAGVN